MRDCFQGGQIQQVTTVMEREEQLAAERKALETLCDEAIARKLRQNLIQSLGPKAFINTEHQVVFESICALFPRGPITMEQLRIHLNNRGFPDTDVEKYFQPATADSTPHGRPGKATS